MNNTSDVIDLIKENSDKCRVHTFGIGEGVSTDLVKQSAVHGKGHYFFIKNLSEIEKRVMEALSKNFYEYLNIRNLNLLNGNGEVI